MTGAQLLGFILIALMIGIVYLTARFISGPKLNGHGIYHITINAWFRNNLRYQNWLKNNKEYHWCVLLIIALCPMILLLIEPFRQNQMFVRPEASLYINIILWTCILFTYKWLYKKNKYEDIKKR